MPERPWPHDRPILIVAAVTPLTDDGEQVDEAAIGPYTRFLVDHGADGVFACGTTGEGVLLSVDERRRVAADYRAALRDASPGARLLVHAGAQTTSATAELAAHATEIGADGVAVIPPPYFPLGPEALTDHLVAAAEACAPLPFFIYAFAARSGYPVPIEVVRRVQDRTPNLAGLKVSESPFERLEPYLDLGLPVLVGYEPLIPAAMARGAVGSVSGLAAAYPDAVRAALDRPDAEAETRLGQLRSELEGESGLIANAKRVIGEQGLPVGRGVRRPLRPA